MRFVQNKYKLALGLFVFGNQSGQLLSTLLSDFELMSMEKNTADSDEEVFIGVPTKKEWQINSALQGYPINLFKTDNSCHSLMKTLTANESDTMNIGEKIQEKPDVILLVEDSEVIDDSSDFSHVEEVSHPCSVLCEESTEFTASDSIDESSARDSIGIYEERPLTEKHSEIMFSLASCASNISPSAHELCAKESPCSKQFKSSSVSALPESCLKSPQSNLMTNLEGDSSSIKKKMHCSSYVELRTDEQNTVRNLLKTWQMHDKKKKLSKSNCYGHAEVISDVTGKDFSHEMAPGLKETPTSLVKQAFQGISEFDYSLGKFHDNKENIVLNREIELTEKDNNALNTKCQSAVFAKNFFSGNADSIKMPSPMPKLPYAAHQLASGKLYDKTPGNHSPQYKKPLPVCRSRIPKSVTKLPTKRHWDVKSPIAKYIEEQPPPPLVKVIKCKENVDVIEENAIKGCEVTPGKRHGLSAENPNQPVLPPAKYCAVKGPSSLSAQSTPRSYKPIKPCSVASVTRHIGTSRTYPGFVYLQNEESVLDLSSKEEKEEYSHETSETGIEMEQSVLEHANIVRSNTILGKWKHK